jgi:DNA replication protein DnaC
MEKKIEKFFKEFIEEKWKPTVTPFSSSDSEENLRKLNEALLGIGKKLIGESFTLDETNQRIYENAALYYMGQEGDFPLHKGLFIWGKVGCGKTLLFQVVGIFCKIFSPRNGYRIEHCHDASNKFQLKGAEALEEFEGGSVCFDELGSEPLKTGHFGTAVAVMPMHIEKRYRLYTQKGRWTHFTSNFDLEWLEENYGKREADRLKEMCHMVKMSGASRRK